MSGLLDERLAACKVLEGPDSSEVKTSVNKDKLVENVRYAVRSLYLLPLSLHINPLSFDLQLYAAKICSYAQGMNLIKEAGKVCLWLYIVRATLTDFVVFLS